MRHMPGMARWVPLVGVGLASLQAHEVTVELHLPLK